MTAATALELPPHYPRNPRPRQVFAPRARTSLIKQSYSSVILAGDLLLEGRHTSKAITSDPFWRGKNGKKPE